MRGSLFSLLVVLSLPCLGFGDCTPTSVPGETDSLLSDGGYGPSGEVPSACAPVAALRCGDVVDGDTSDLDGGAVDAMNGYPVAVGNYRGPELTYAFTPSHTGTVTARFVDPEPSALDQDLFVLDAADGVCSPERAFTRGFNEVTFEVTAGETVHVVVDAAEGVEGAFQLALECDGGEPTEPLPAAECDGDRVTGAGLEALRELALPNDGEDAWDTYDRIDAIASSFEACGDPRGVFPTAYRHITGRMLDAIEDGEIQDQVWADRLVVDFAGRFLRALDAWLSGDRPSYAWEHYFTLAEHPDVSRSRTLAVAVTAHLTLDLPYALRAVGTTEEHEEDYYLLGELLIDVVPAFLEDLQVHYDVDAAPLLGGFFVGDHVDSVLGEDTTITWTFQVVRTKAWNSRWLLAQPGGGWIAPAASRLARTPSMLQKAA